MNTFIYATGRTYNGPQMLSISFPDVIEDDNMLDDCNVTFIDASRNIKGTVRIMVCCLLSSKASIGRDVMDMYDKGLYTLI
jgi:hypothetical protein